ncbi:uncharacterized protein MAM_06137 [Metarhizium album ARSEF 1941]|uniref:Uncharacterized protein n=1 Tax=Metarhizium album (strain ARSEF 1941) TaxID=1081103 RepID=A0A0B2WRA7_METAS|nr:uncharacterized protein MAM_06137 [Metarhizium album ARSEF 1941]KHN96032.1 hypothetical protein MAM_06137 [Metarhizium album ARSEF 1941]
MASTCPPPAYTAGTALPSYDELMKRFNDRVGANPTPEKYLEVGDTFSLQEIEILVNNGPCEPPFTCPEDAKKFRVSAGKGLSSKITLDALKQGAEEATNAAQRLRRMFRELHDKVIEIDQIEVSGFEPDMRKFQETGKEFESILSGSRAVATQISSFGTRLDKLIIPFVMDEELGLEDKKRVVRQFIDGAKGHEKSAKNVQTKLLSLQTRFISFVPRFDSWAQRKEGDLHESIRAIQRMLEFLQGELLKIEEKIRVVQGIMGLSGALMLGALAGGPVGLILGIFGFIGVTASAAILVSYYRKRSDVQRQILAKENEIEEIRKEIQKIQDARAGITALRDEYLPTINDSIDILHSYWQRIIGDAQRLLEYLSGAEDIEIPEYLDDYINEGIAVYSSIAEYIKDFARGISGVLGEEFIDPPVDSNLFD